MTRDERFSAEHNGFQDHKTGRRLTEWFEIIRVLNELAEENEQLKQYKQSVSDVLINWSQKNLTAKQLQVVIAIMEELNILGDVE